MKVTLIFRLGWVISLLCCGALPAQLRVVTTIPDLADLARRIGGDAVKVQSLTAGHEDLHLVRARPSLLIKLRRADAFIELGLDAEHAWVPALLRNARNEKINPGGAGFCNASLGIQPLQVPNRATRAAGPDIHPRGNPHYNLDPTRMRRAARNVRDLLVRAAPQHRKAFGKRLVSWEKELDGRLAGWKKKLAPFRGAEFIEYHNAWVYFAEAFELRIIAKLEPAPGLAPTPSHLAEVLEIAKRRKVGLVVARPQNADIARRVAVNAGAKVAILQLSSTTKGKTRSWFDYMDHVVATFASSLRKPPATKRAEAKSKPPKKPGSEQP